MKFVSWQPCQVKSKFWLRDPLNFLKFWFFGDFWFWYRLQNFGKVFAQFAHFGKILIFEFWWNRKVMINHRGGILIFCQILSKLKILDFRVKDFKFCDFVKFWILGLRISNLVNFRSKFSSNLFKKFSCVKIEILWSRVNDLKFWFSLGLRISNFTKSPKSKFSKITKFYPKKFLISQILWVLGY